MPEHSFDTEIAKKYGILEAVLLKHIYFWVKKNQANKLHYHDGRYWTYNTAKAFQELFDYASLDKIKRALKHLKDENLIETGMYNEDIRDRTLWYTVTDFALCIVQDCSMESADLHNAKSASAQPLPYIKHTDINTDNNKISNEILLQRFERFWKAYPVKSGKGDARKSWLKIKPSEELTDTMIQAIGRMSHEDKRWLEGYIPNPSTWLNQSRWEDEPVTNEKQSAPAGNPMPWAKHMKGIKTV